MEKFRTISLHKSVFENNDKKADELRAELKDKGLFLINVMSSPGAGKTTTLTAWINALKDTYHIGVMEADIDGDCDAERIIDNTGARAIQCHTDGMCHLDSGMTRAALEAIDIKDLNLVYLENVGNLVCPAEFDTGAQKNVVILSVPEGDDKPIKYPLMFSKADLVIISKIDIIEYFDFDFEKVETNTRMRNPDCKIIKVSGKTLEGIDELSRWTKEEIEAWKK